MYNYLPEPQRQYTRETVLRPVLFPSRVTCKHLFLSGIVSREFHDSWRTASRGVPVAHHRGFPEDILAVLFQRRMEGGVLPCSAHILFSSCVFVRVHAFVLCPLHLPGRESNVFFAGDEVSSLKPCCLPYPAASLVLLALRGVATWFAANVCDQLHGWFDRSICL